MYSLHLLGGASLEGPEGPVEGRAAQRRPLALLALLATAENLTASRDSLLGLVWPESPPEKARPRLSVALHGIRKALGSESVMTVGDDLRLNTDVVEVDLVGFLGALDREDPERAVEIYGGSFLEGFHVRGSGAFERWLDQRQEEYARGYRGALEELAERAEAEDAWEEAVRWWRDRAAEEPCSSRVALRLMKALAASGDRPAALRHARVHAAMVKDTLGMEPDPEVRALAERLEKDELEVEESDDATAPGVPPSPRSVDGKGEIPSSGPAEAGAPGPVADTDGVPSPALVTGPRLVVAALLVGGLATFAAATVLNEDAPALDARRVLVDVFENRTGDPALDEIGRMAADWITQGLTYTGFVDVVTRGRAILPGQAATEDADGDGRGELLARIARANGTGTLVWGSFQRTGDSVYFRAHVTEADDRRDLASLEPVAAAVDDPVQGLEELRDRVMARLATLTDERLARWQEHASKPPTFEAYQRFVEGLELHTTQRRAADAAERFRRAAALDSSFTMATLWEALVQPDRQEALRLLRALNARRETLPPLDRAFLDYQLAIYRDRDWMAGLRAARRMVEIAPGSSYLKLAGQAALRADRPAEAVRFYEQADPESGWLRGWTPYWFSLARAYLELDDPEGALAVALRGRALFPDEPDILNVQIQVLSHLGRIEELEALAGEAEQLDDDGWYWSFLARAHLGEGNTKRALAVAQKGRARHPESDDLFYLEMHSLALLGRTAEMEAALTDPEAVDTGGWKPDRVSIVPEELLAHGHEGRSHELYPRAVELAREGLASEGNPTLSDRLSFLHLLLAAGDLPEADERLEVILAEHPENPSVLRAAAHLRAAQGRRAEAMEFVRRYDEVGGSPFADPEPTAAALLGERERAMRLLRMWGRERVSGQFLHHSPLLDSLRDYPPFQDFLEEGG